MPAGAGAEDVLPEVPVGEGSAGVVGAAGSAGVVGAAGAGSLGVAAGVLGVAAGVLGDAGLAWAAAAVVSAGVAGDAAGDALADAPPAAFSKSARCVRNSTSLARIAGSIVVVPEVPTAPAAPAAGAGDSSARCSPTSAFRFD